MPNPILKNIDQRGNALFLILIAVALFAALSYAITQSGRGGGSISSQTTIIAASQVIEQPAAVRAAIQRMMVTGDTAQSITFTGASQYNVFDTATGGGGATSLTPPAEVCEVATDCQNGWTYVQATTGAGNFVEGVGTAGANGGDAFAVLQGISGMTLSACTAIQKGLGYTNTVPPVATVQVLWGTPGSYSAAGNPATVSSGSGTTTDALWGQDFACINNQ